MSKPSQTSQSANKETTKETTGSESSQTSQPTNKETPEKTSEKTPKEAKGTGTNVENKMVYPIRTSTIFGIMFCFIAGLLFCMHLMIKGTYGSVRNIPNTGKPYAIHDTTQVASDRALEIALQAWENSVGIVMDGLSSDISTLEMMLTVLAAILGLFAYFGIVRLLNMEEVQKKQIENFVAKNKKILRKLKLREVQQRDLIKQSKIQLNNPKNPVYNEEILELLTQDILRKNKNDYEVVDYMTLGKYYYAKNQFDMSIKKYKEAMDYCESKRVELPEDFYFYLALSYDDLPDYDKAISNYDEAYKNALKDTTKATIRSNEGFTYLEMARVERVKNNREGEENYLKRAERVFEEASKLNDKDSIIWYGRAITHYELIPNANNKTKAMEDYCTKAEENIGLRSEYEVNYSKRQYENTIAAINHYFKFQKPS